MREAWWGLVILACVSVVCFSFLKGCTESSQRYYGLADTCVKNGGSWLDSSGANGQCIYGRTSQP